MCINYCQGIGKTLDAIDKKLEDSKDDIRGINSVMATLGDLFSQPAADPKSTKSENASDDNGTDEDGHEHHQPEEFDVHDASKPEEKHVGQSSAEEILEYLDRILSYLDKLDEVTVKLITLTIHDELFPDQDLMDTVFSKSRALEVKIPLVNELMDKAINKGKSKTCCPWYSCCC